MMVKVIPTVIGALGTVPKSQEKESNTLEIRGKIKTIQSTALLEESWRPEKT